jgi:hypothetical protein
MVWVKDGMGLGYYARQNHELLLIGGNGTMSAPAQKKSGRLDSPQSRAAFGLPG